jgi:hypothetical protein
MLHEHHLWVHEPFYLPHIVFQRVTTRHYSYISLEIATTDFLYLPQELIDLTISHIEDRKTLASLRLVSSPCRRSVDPIYFKRLFIMVSSKSVANVSNLIQSPYKKYIEEIHWADKELQDHLQDNLEAFQDTFKERLTGLSREDIVVWHEKYRAMYIDQKNTYSLLCQGAIQLKLESFVNVKRVSVNNGCEPGTEQYLAALDAQEIFEHPAQWGTMTQAWAHRGRLYIWILKSLAESQTSHTITHFSIKTQGSKWDEDVMPPTFMGEGGSAIYV